MRIEHSVQKSLLGSWKKNSKKQKNEQIEKTVVVFPCFVKTKAMKASFLFSFTMLLTISYNPEKTVIWQENWVSLPQKAKISFF